MRKKSYYFREVQENPSIIWDNLESVGVNILANLGLIPEGPIEVKIIDKHGKMLSSPEQKKRFADYANNIKRKHEKEVVAIQRAILSTSSEADILSASPNDYISVELSETLEKKLGETKSSKAGKDSLPEGIEQIFGALTNLSKSGGLDHLYAIIEFAQQRSTNIAVSEYTDIQESTEALVRQLGEDFEDKTTAAKLYDALEENLEKWQIEELKLLVEFGQLEKQPTKKTRKDTAEVQPIVADNADVVASYDKEIAYLIGRNKLLEELIQPLKRAQESIPEESAATEKRWDLWFDNVFVKITSPIEKLMETTISKRADTDAKTYAALLRQQMSEKKASNEAMEAKCTTLEKSIAVKERYVMREKAKRTELIAALHDLDNQLFELNAFSSSDAKSKETYKPQAGAVVKVDIPVEGDKKKFSWDLEEGLCDNLTQLLNDYLKSSGYHTWGRKKSANAVLKSIAEITATEKDPIKQDLEILRIIRAETKKVSSHGANGQASQLFAIYTQAELRFRERINKEVAESKELNSKNKEKVPLLIELKKQVETTKRVLSHGKRLVEAKKAGTEKADEPAPKTAILSQGGGQLAAKVKEVEALRAKNLALRQEYVGYAAESLQKELAEVERELEQAKQQEVVLKARLSESEEKYNSTDTELARIQAECGEVEKRILIRYLEVSQQARKLGHSELFGEKKAPQNNEYTLLPRLVGAFIEELKKRLGWGEAVKKEPASSKSEAEPEPKQATEPESGAEPDAFDQMLEQITPPTRRK